ncbi:predicted protein [Sclerotinia sclerotiorum 1980 UF-70]|uniref:Uncharacterized protein n=1 Tax=Sclerotinia sclerotiorum (strain ATCC 18683 / 1980 / Ss-1) TaxID=665079 RepID=A7EM29_SCLS1|nr:predicted protein [Sclerotinia sclerotiorum 1980 UF-70]EDO03895.1 predicted protein [Sclerotinia sclerotiorum 1980 UF-70]
MGDVIQNITEHSTQYDQNISSQTKFRTKVVQMSQTTPLQNTLCREFKPLVYHDTYLFKSSLARTMLIVLTFASKIDVSS